MKSLEKPSPGSHSRIDKNCLALSVLEGGYGLREWAKGHDRSMSEVYDLALRELASDRAVRERILGVVDHSAARVFCDTGDYDFDRFASTTFSMQTLMRGTDKRAVLEQLSMELLDPFLELRQQRHVTRVWLGLLMSNTYESERRVYRFGETARIALLAASLLGYHDDDPLFVWAVENREGIMASATRQWSRVMGDISEEDGYPPFDLWLMRHHGEGVVRKVNLDTDSLFCRRLMRDSVINMDDWNDIQYVNGPFFAEFTKSLGFTPKTLADFSDETFMKQVRWFEGKKGPNKSTYRLLCRFYEHVMLCLPASQRQLTFPSSQFGMIREEKRSLES